MDKIQLTVKDLKDLGIPCDAIYFKILNESGKRIYEFVFRYKGKLYKTTAYDYNLKGYNDDGKLICIIAD